MKLTYKITLIILAVSLVGTAVVGFVLSQRAATVLQSHVSEEQSGIAEGVMDKVDRLLYERYLNIQTIATVPLFQDMLLGGNNLAIAKKRLTELTLLTGPWDALDIANAKGDIIIASDVDYTVEQQDEKKAFEEALSGKVYYSDAVVGDQGKPTIIFSAPIRDESKPGKPIIGVALGNYSWPVIQEVLSAASGETHLINNKGLLLASNNKDHTFLQDFSSLQSVKNMLSGKEGSVEEQSVGDNYLSLASYVTEDGYLQYQGNGWGLLITEPTATAFAPASGLSRVIVLILVFFLMVLSGVLIAAIYVSVLRPVDSLAKAAKKISSGNLNVRATVASHDEIGQLAGSFNSMVDSIVSQGVLQKSIIDTLPGALFITDTNGNISQINPMVTELFGYTSEELRGKSIDVLFPTTTTTTLHLIGLDELAETGKVQEKVTTMLAKDASSIPVTLYGRLIHEEKTGEQIVLLVAIDRRAAQRYAAERLSKLTPILQRASLGDFSEEVKIPEKEDEFSEHMVALNLMIDDLRETVGKNFELVKALEAEKAGLEEKVKARTHDIDASNQQLKAANQQLNAANQQLGAAQKNLQEKLLELERFNKVAVGRELKMVELKEEIARLKGGVK